MTPLRMPWTPAAPAAVLALVALALAACGSTRQPAPAAGSPAPATGYESDASAIAKARADSLRYPYTRADVDFMSHMIGHHAQALLMADLAPTHGASGSVRTLAERIINGQQDEIATMQRWLRDRRQVVPEPALSLANGAQPMGKKMGEGHDHHHAVLMPGMLTEAQMRQLDQARGPEFDRLFLTLMIQHHRGAVSMVDDLFGSRGAGRDETVFKFANDVSVDQSTEVKRMEQMLDALGPGAASP